MKTLVVQISFNLPEDPGAFRELSARMIWEALCRAFPLCRMSAIEVRELPLLMQPEDVIREARADALETFAEEYDEIPSAQVSAELRRRAETIRRGEEP